jgi:predicted ATPase with chaperone activity
MLTMNSVLLRDRLDLLIEVESISETIAVCEQRYGTHADFDEVRQRVQAVRATVIEQLRALMAWDAHTVH